MTLCLMMEKNKVLGDVLKRVADRKGEFLEKNAFIFKPFNDSFGIHGLKPNNQVGNPDESAQYKAMHNLSGQNFVLQNEVDGRTADLGLFCDRFT